MFLSSSNCSLPPFEILQQRARNIPSTIAMTFVLLVPYPSADSSTIHAVIRAISDILAAVPGMHQ